MDQSQFACYPQPCWNGIRPGVTTRQEAERIIRQDPSLSNVREIVLPNGRGSLLGWQSFSNPATGGMLSGFLNSNLIATIYVSLSGPDMIPLSDAIALYGQPLFVHEVVGERQTVDGMYVQFDHFVTAVIYYLNDPHANLLVLDSRIGQLIYSASGGEMTKSNVWHGFGDYSASAVSIHSTK